MVSLEGAIGLLLSILKVPETKQKILMSVMYTNTCEFLTWTVEL